MKAPRRVHVTVPEDVEGLYRWCVKYDPRFQGNAASVVAHFFQKGIEAEYAHSIQEAEPLDEKGHRALAASQSAALSSAASE